MQCSIHGCLSPVRSVGLCSMHYIRKNRHGDPLWVNPAHSWSRPPRETWLQRFWSKVDTSGDCWLWTAHVVNGYGGFSMDGKLQKAHRLCWEVFNGPIPCGQVIRHSCDTPLCVRPEHLLAGSPAENARDMVERNRSSRGGRHPRAKLTEEDVQLIWAKLKEGHSQRRIASDFAVTPGVISHIVHGRNWKHVAPPS